MPFCTQCGKKVQDSAIFCSNCGTKLAPIEKPQQIVSDHAELSFPMDFTVSREKQFVCAGTSYKVIINGQNLGNIGVGKAKSASIYSEDVSVEIRCTTILMTGIHASFQLKVIRNNPGVTFKLRNGGPIDAKVHGAEIISFNGDHDGKYL